MLLIGVSLFLLGSALSGLSWSMESLILFRGVQGLGAGALFPISLAVIGDLFSPKERGRYQGLFGAVFGVAAVIGPLLGGWLTDNASWHWIFYVNLPIGAVTLYIIARYLPPIKRPDVHYSLDYLGAAVFTVAISALLVGLTYKGVVDPSTGQPYGWTDPIVGGLLLVALVVGAAFLLIESRAKEPIVPLDLFRNRVYAVSILAVFLAAFGFFAAVVFLPRWFQFVKGISPTESGLQTLALLLGVILSSIVSGIIISRTGRYKLLIVGALALMSLGLYLMTGITYTTDLPMLWVWMFITGVGIGPTLAAFTIVVQSAVPFSKLGVATGNLTFFRQVGGSVGLAVVGTIFAQVLADAVVPSLIHQGIPEQFAGQLGAFAGGASGQIGQVGQDLHVTLAAVLPPQAQPFIDQIVNGVYDAFSQAVASTFWVGMVAALAALVVTLVLPEVPLRGLARRGTSDEAASPERSAPELAVPGH
jgi:EmrB/QacA subfamily drug resistance transporter